MLASRTRRPAVAGYFYPSDADALRARLTLLSGSREPRAQTAVLLPHGALERSGAVVAQALRCTEIPRRCVIVGASHNGRGPFWSLLRHANYSTPLGEVPLDEELADALIEQSAALEVDDEAHDGEYAIEALLPWLQAFGPADLAIVPIVARASADDGLPVGEALARAIRRAGEPVLLVASSDLSHYLPHSLATRDDARLIGQIESLDVAEFCREMAQRGASVCGAAAIVAMMVASRELGARRGGLVRYATSVDTGGDPESAIGYAGIVVN